MNGDDIIQHAFDWLDAGGAIGSMVAGFYIGKYAGIIKAALKGLAKLGSSDVETPV